MATCGPALPQRNGRKPGWAASPLRHKRASWVEQGEGCKRVRSWGCDRRGCAGWEAFPLVISPGLRANLSTQCYHRKPAHGWDGCAHTVGPQEIFSSPYSFWAFVVLSRNMLWLCSLGLFPVAPGLPLLMDVPPVPPRWISSYEE